LKYSDTGIKFTESFEGCRLEAYLDQGGIPTIGYGHIHGVKMGDKCTQEQAEQWLSDEVKNAEDAVNDLVQVPLTQNQFDALVDFVYNLGAGNFEKSTLLRRLNKGLYKEASEQFALWNRAGGFVRDGLTRRRVAEKELFLREIP
jgi:lysozyme